MARREPRNLDHIADGIIREEKGFGTLALGGLTVKQRAE
jgi:hypothetical protein